MLMRPKNVTWPDCLSLNNFRIAPKIGSENHPKIPQNSPKSPENPPKIGQFSPLHFRA